MQTTSFSIKARRVAVEADRRWKVLINNLDSQVIKRAPWKTQVITGIHAVPAASHGMNPNLLAY